MGGSPSEFNRSPSGFGRRTKGRLRGKQPKLNRKQEAHLVALVHSGEYSTLEVAELFGVGRPASDIRSGANFAAVISGRVSSRSAKR